MEGLPVAVVGDPRRQGAEEAPPLPTVHFSVEPIEDDEVNEEEVDEHPDAWDNHQSLVVPPSAELVSLVAPGTPSISDDAALPTIVEPTWDGSVQASVDGPDADEDEEPESAEWVSADEGEQAPHGLFLPDEPSVELASQSIDADQLGAIADEDQEEGADVWSDDEGRLLSQPHPAVPDVSGQDALGLQTEEMALLAEHLKRVEEGIRFAIRRMEGERHSDSNRSSVAGDPVPQHFEEHGEDEDEDPEDEFFADVEKEEDEEEEEDEDEQELQPVYEEEAEVRLVGEEQQEEDEPLPLPPIPASSKAIELPPPLPDDDGFSSDGDAIFRTAPSTVASSPSARSSPLLLSALAQRQHTLP